MDRPLSNSRPIGPFLQSGGQCKIRAKFMFTSKSGPTEAIPSLKESIRSELNQIVPNSNITVNKGEFGEVEISFDVDKKTFNNKDEDKVERALGRALMDGGAENVRADSYTYTAVSR